MICYTFFYNYYTEQQPCQEIFWPISYKHFFCSASQYVSLWISQKEVSFCKVAQYGDISKIKEFIIQVSWTWSEFSNQYWFSCAQTHKETKKKAGERIRRKTSSFQSLTAKFNNLKIIQAIRMLSTNIRSWQEKFGRPEEAQQYGLWHSFISLDLLDIFQVIFMIVLPIAKMQRNGSTRKTEVT